MLLILIGIIILIIVFTSSISNKYNVPLIIIALATGIFFGSDITGLIDFDDAVMTQTIANTVLIFVLFSGGFGTQKTTLKPVIKPSILLATAGVVLTMVITALLFSVFTHYSLLTSFTLAAIISSTDAAAVFSIMKNHAIHKRVSSILEIESASNDPMAIVLTTFIIALAVGNSADTGTAFLHFIWQLSGGTTIGIIVGTGAVYLLKKIGRHEIEYLHLFLIGIILMSFGIADLCKASGLLSAFFAGFIMGNKTLPYRAAIASFLDTLTFIANVGLFILLGLLVFPSKFVLIWLPGLLLFVLLTFISRPVAVLITTAFMKLTRQEKTFLAWGGIRGAVPIVLATYPAAAGLDPEHELFNIIFFAVTLSIIIQGSTIGKVSSKLRLLSKRKNKQHQSMQLVNLYDTNFELIELFLDEDDYDGECTVADLDLPPAVTITMIVRSGNIISPSGKTLILPEDRLSILVEKSNEKEVRDIIADKLKKHTIASP